MSNEVFNQQTGEYKPITKLFMKQLQNDISDNKTNHWAEKQNADNSGIMLDFDFLSVRKQVQITSAMKEKLTFELAKFILSKLELNNENGFNDELYYAVIHRKNINKTLMYNEKHKCHKDGLHFIMPEIMLNREAKRWLIYAINKSGLIEKSLPKCIFLDEEDVLDINSAHVPVLLIGSCKRGKTAAYPVFNYYSIEPDTLEYKVIKMKRKENPIIEFALNKSGFEELTEKNMYNLNTKAKFELVAWEKELKEKSEKWEIANEKYAPDLLDIKLVHESSDKFTEALTLAVLSIDPERARSNRSWRRVLKSLKQISICYDIELFNLADEFSKLCDEAYVRVEDVKGVWDRVKPFGYLSYIMYIVKQDSTSSARDFWHTYFTICPSPLERDGVFTTYKDYRKMSKAKSVTQKTVEKWANVCLCVLAMDGGSRILVKTVKRKTGTNIKLTTYKHHKKSNFYQNNDAKISIVNEAGVVKRITVGSIVKKLIGEEKLATYDELEWVPYLWTEPTTENLNTFPRFAYVDATPDPTFDFTKTATYKLIVNQLCGTNTDNKISTFVLDWIADIIQNPASLPGTALLLISTRHGVGKDLFRQFISRMIGVVLTNSFTNVRDLVGEMNGDQADKLLITVNEVGEGDGNNAVNVIKGLITAETKRIRKLYENGASIDNYARLMFFSNKKTSMSIENSDRRICAIICKNNHAQKASYFKPIVEEILKNDSFSCNAFHWFANRKITSNLNQAPQTEFKHDVVMNQLSSPLLYMKYCYEESLSNLLDGDDRDGNVITVSTKTLYVAYKTWCTSDNESICGKRKFITELECINLKLKSYRTTTVRISGYRLNVDTILSGFRYHLNDETFTFNELEIVE